MTSRQFLLCAIGLVLLAFGLREWHILASVVANPEAGDVSSYLRYALHMTLDGTFSQAGDVHPVPPDAYRGPGYPLFLAAVLEAVGRDGWYGAVYQAQAIIGAATVGLTIALARNWLPYGGALLAGALLAIWPHHIAATNAMLIEVVFGFVLVLGLLLAQRGKAVAAGAVFGFAYLVNPLIALFPFVLLAIYWRKQGVTILLVSLLAVAGWGMRNVVVGANADGRGWQNLVQGSYPGYHHAQKWWVWLPEDHILRDRITEDEGVIVADHLEGVFSIALRLTSDPLHYAYWYASKPALLWDWDVRMGQGRQYTLDVRDSPLDGALLPMTIFAWMLNPLLFWLALGGSLGALRNREARAVAALFLYVTAVHVVLQAEPRYAIAYRALEMLMAVTALAWLLQGARAVGRLLVESALRHRVREC